MLPYGSDALYHLRRIAYSARHFPASLDFDPYLHFPEGARPIWTPAFDWTLALLLRPLVGSDPAALERAAMWVPPLLGGATVVVAHALARRHFGALAAWTGALALVFLSGHFWYSQVGFLDHHAAVALVSTLLLAAGMDFAARPSAGRAALLGLAMVAMLWLWPGTLLHVALVQGGCLLHATTLSDRRAGRAMLLHLAAAHGLAALLMLPAAGENWPQWGRFSPVVLSAFQPWWLTWLGVAAALSAGLWRTRACGAGPLRRALSAAGVAALGLALSAALVPDLMAGAGDAWRWLARREVFQAGVGESQPLLWSQGRFTLSVALTRLSGFVLLLPVALWAAARAARRPDAAALRLLLWWTLGLLAATLAQRRFFNSSSVALALLLGWSAAAAWRAGPRGPGAAALLAAVLGLLLLPCLQTHALHLGNQWRALQGRPLVASDRRLQARVLLETADWMRHHTPPTSGWQDPAQRPEYGVMGPWDAGHALQYWARRPTVVDNFGDDLGPEGFARAGRYFRGTEAEALAIADTLGLRYALVGPTAGVGAPRPGPESLYHSLRGGPGAPVPVRHRLVYESRPAARGAPDPPSLYRVFEIVPGARIRGRTRPGAQVALELRLRSNRLRLFSYSAVARADGEGRFVFRVPYATRGAPASVQAVSAYRLRCAQREVQVAVDESAVLAGSDIPAPDPCPAVPD